MITALWIIAICEIIRAIQNGIQLKVVYSNETKELQKKAYEEFIASLKETDKEFGEKMIREWEKDLEGECI